MDKIIIKGAREHNLKDVNLEIPKNKLVIITGVSGSGKSSLAFDTIYAEGQRRYLESLSSYARQFLDMLEKPDVDSIEGLSPAISIDQKSTSHNPRSTVGTVTEINDYLRLLFARIGEIHCYECGTLVKKASIDEVVDQIKKDFSAASFKIFSPVVQGRKGEFKNLFEELRMDGFFSIKVDGKNFELSEEIPPLEKQVKHNIDLFLDEFGFESDDLFRLYEAIETSIARADGLVKIVSEDGTEKLYNLSLVCPNCGLAQSEPEPRSFSFNSPFGACSVCDGLGIKPRVDASLVVPDEEKTISEGAIMPWSYKPNNWYGNIIKAVCVHYRINPSTPFKNLRDSDKQILLFGNADGSAEEVIMTYHTKGGTSSQFKILFKGIVNYLEERYWNSDSPRIKNEIEKYVAETNCPECHGARLKKERLSVLVNKKNFFDVSELAISSALDFFENIKLEERHALVGERLVREIKARLKFLVNVGLDYLTLGRSANTLSGGEAQRIRLASQLGSRLTGILYVLDEPSIGLHPRDNQKLIDVLKDLRDIGNTVLVVEHDEETIIQADWIVDVGPVAGKGGGQIVYSGEPEKIDAENSLTGAYMSGAKSIAMPETRRKPKGWVKVENAYENNLKQLNAEFPLGIMTVVTGVSGSGKSTLVNDVLYKSAARKLNRALVKPGKHKKVTGLDGLDRVVLISQDPIGRTPRSNPATYTGVFTPIRELFALTREAQIRAYAPGRFSFNVAGGRCENCSGDGSLRVEMQFLSDVYVPCEICKGSRYNRETLSVKLGGKNIAEVLKMNVTEACEFFKEFPKIYEKLKVLKDVGLGYIELGQSATTLSGGEAQRIKLAKELTEKKTLKTLYILDEPTTGLHIDDVNKLLGVLNRLVDQNNSMVIIEHNLDVIKSADWIIDLGPEGGAAGGKIIAKGTPEDVASEPNSVTGKFIAGVLK